MYPTKLRIAMAVMLVFTCLTAAAGLCYSTTLPQTRNEPEARAPGQGDPARQPAYTDAKPLLAEKFDEIQKLIKPHPGESRWMDIPWQISLWEARKKAAAEGKPIFVWSGSGGAPCVHT